jgi:pilus assembly protein TadC
MKKSIIYTDSASKKLESVLEKIKKDITDDVINSKNYPGEELIEITASDIEDTYERVVIRNKKTKFDSRSRMIKLILPVYFIMGILITIYGLFRKDIQDLISGDKVELTYVLTGFIVSLTTGAAFYLLKQRENERKREYLKEKLDIERQLLEREIEFRNFSKKVKSE